MPALPLLDAAPSLWTYTTPFLASLLSFVVGYIVLRLNRNYTENRESEKSKDQWRESVLAANKALREDLAAEKSERIQWQLKREAELASIAGILEESTQAHKLLAAIAATTQAHGGQLQQLETRLNMMQTHVNSLALTIPHAKP